MGSSIAWVDRDSTARQRSLQLISSFNAPESRDELGIGGVRDAIADILFPGTSTIQTRLRYMFHIPWLMAQLEDRRISSRELPAASRRAEIQLMEAFQASGESDYIGSDAGSSLKRLPSSVYWAGLEAWGFRLFSGAQSRYFAAMDDLYLERRAHRKAADDDEEGFGTASTWHQQVLKLMPDGYPKGATMSIERAEAELLLDLWGKGPKGSLLNWLAQDTADRQQLDPVDEIWLHPRQVDFPPALLVLVGHAHRFAYLVKAAALLYNLQLAERSGREQLVEDYRQQLSDRARENQDLLADWVPTDLWAILGQHGSPPDKSTRDFVQSWLELSRNAGNKVAALNDARQLIQRREGVLKKARSRFASPAALRQWSGSAGLGLLNYRWNITQRFLQEWFEGYQQ
ncbi:MAG: hypothetical protein K0Q68_288 [Moraxellaceae bacterium]|jgi:hypothetical protein|nr:hypothetical protein [Moraxellaceae bacterium]